MVQLWQYYIKILYQHVHVNVVHVSCVTAVIAILSAIGLDRYRRSQSQGAVGYRPILSTITEPIEGFPAVYRRLLDSYRDIVIVRRTELH